MDYSEGITLHTASSAVTIGAAFSSERMRINNDGNVGIGTTNPGTKLHIEGVNKALSDQIGNLVVYTNDANAIDKGGSITLGGRAYSAYNFSLPFASVAGRKETSGDAYFSGYLQFATSWWNNNELREWMRITSAGNVGIGTTSPAYKLDVAGGVNASGGYTQVSDSRLKKNITPLRNSLQKVIHLQGVNYDWRTEEFPSKNFDASTQLGLIAQDVESIVPEIVKTDNAGYKALAYDKLTAVLVEAIKELKSEKDAELASKNADIQAQKNEIKELKVAYDAHLKSLKQEITEIKQLLAK